MFFVIKKNKILIVVLCVFIVALLLSTLFTVKFTSSPKFDYTIVIDAGHGGIDGGTVGDITGITERELNLVYAKKLAALCKEASFNVVMTRTNLNGLYDTFSENKKKDDMLKREEIIKKANPDLVISLHMNSFPLESSRGAQCFFKEGHKESIFLANKIQECLYEDLPHAREFSLKGDYYILNCSNYPSVIIECGYLSNSEEEKLLLQDDYQDKVVYSVFKGIYKFFGNV